MQARTQFYLKTQENPNKIDSKKSVPRNVRIKLLKIKDKGESWNQPERNAAMPGGEHQIKSYWILHVKP